MLFYVGALYYLGMKIMTSKVRASEDARGSNITKSDYDRSEAKETKTFLVPESLENDGGLSDPMVQTMPLDFSMTLTRRVIFFLG
jgi:hypothetical protein